MWLGEKDSAVNRVANQPIYLSEYMKISLKLPLSDHMKGLIGAGFYN